MIDSKHHIDVKSNSITSGQRNEKPGQADLIKQALKYEFHSVLDVGAGTGWVAQYFAAQGRDVSATFLNSEDNIESVVNLGNFPLESMPSIESDSFDAIWASHVLEHCVNVGNALSECYRILKPNGILFLSVPPFKHNVVGGHVSVGWNIGILTYLLCIYGFDVKNGSFIKHGYNIAAFVRKGTPPEVALEFSSVDFEKLDAYLPEWLKQGTYGDINKYNWTWQIKPLFKSNITKKISSLFPLIAQEKLRILKQSIG